MDIDMLSNSKNISKIITVCLIFYIIFLNHTLSFNMRRMFASPIFTMIILFMILYKGYTDLKISLLITISYIMTCNQIYYMEVMDLYNNIKK